jgi:hypothetical protein
MKIAFFSEMGFSGKIPRDHPNMRTEFAWLVALDAVHYPISTLGNIDTKYDIGIVIVPKKNIENISQIDIPTLMRECCDKVAFMQEGPCWYFEDYPLDQQVWFYNLLMDMDMLFCHNQSDIEYYSGLTSKPCHWMPTLMIDDNLPKSVPKDKAIIGGNMCQWYGGFPSMIVAQEFGVPMFAPSMGRKIDGEEELDITHLPYMQWSDWIQTLSTFKYGVHMMRTHAAGTFALNCAALGIPCIGYYGLDTQHYCHPFLTVNDRDVKHAVMCAKRLKKDKIFYREMSHVAKTRYKEIFSEEKFKERLEGYM